MSGFSPRNFRLIAMLLLAAAPTLLSAKPGDSAATVLDGAIVELRKEFIAAQKDSQAQIREKCNYFIDHPAEIDPKELISALEKPLGQDMRLAAYIKWQLLSAMPEIIAADQLPRALEVYRKAPLPTQRVGMSESDRRKLDGMLTSAKKDDHIRINDSVVLAVEKWTTANRFILAYRDEFYSKLPASYDTYVTAFRDAYERLSFGVPTKVFVERLVEDATAWANSGDATPRQCAALAGLIYKLRSERGPKYYVGIAERQGKPYWVTRTEPLYDGKKLGELQMLLEKKGGVPPADSGIGLDEN